MKRTIILAIICIILFYFYLLISLAVAIEVYSGNLFTQEIRPADLSRELIKNMQDSTNGIIIDNGSNKSIAQFLFDSHKDLTNYRCNKLKIFIEEEITCGELKEILTNIVSISSNSDSESQGLDVVISTLVHRPRYGLDRIGYVIKERKDFIRLFGDIEEIPGQISAIKILSIKIPIEVKGNSWLKYHIGLFILLVFIILISYSFEGGKYEKN